MTGLPRQRHDHSARMHRVENILETEDETRNLTDPPKELSRNVTIGIELIVQFENDSMAKYGMDSKARDERWAIKSGCS